MTTVERYASAAYALLVAGAGISPWPWTALLVAGAFLAFLAFVADKRDSNTNGPADEAESQP